MQFLTKKKKKRFARARDGKEKSLWKIDDVCGAKACFYYRHTRQFVRVYKNFVIIIIIFFK